MKKNLLFVTLIFIAKFSNSQTIFSDNYTSSSTWSEQDDLDNQINFNSGFLVFNTTWSLSNSMQSNARTFKPLGTILRTSDKLKVDIDFKISQNLGNQNGLILFALSQKTTQPYVTRNLSGTYDCNKNSSISISLGDGFISLQLKGVNSFQNNTYNCPNSYSKDIYGLNLTTGAKYYFRYIKQQNAHRLQIFTSASRLFSSKIFDTLLCSNIAVDSMAYLMHGNQSVAGWDRTFEVSIDSSSIEKNYNDNSTVCSSSSITIDETKHLGLHNFPNPSTTFTEVFYTIPYNVMKSRIVIYTLYGNVVADFPTETIKGNHKLNLSTLDFPNGFYLYSLELDGNIESTQKMQIVK